VFTCNTETIGTRWWRGNTCYEMEIEKLEARIADLKERLEELTQ
jgi:hypothetical protein